MLNSIILGNLSRYKGDETTPYMNTYKPLKKTRNQTELAYNTDNPSSMYMIIWWWDNLDKHSKIKVSKLLNSQNKR